MRLQFEKLIKRNESQNVEIANGSNSLSDIKLLVDDKVSKSFKVADASSKMSQQEDLVTEQTNEKFVKLKIEIIDSGVGIKKENLGKLFMEFGKLDEHSKENSQGTGLGLSICKRMIEQMGGQVMVDSEEKIGTTFTILINAKAKIPQPLGSMSESSLMESDNDE